MSFVELIDPQRYWWHLYIERLDSFEGREVNPPEANYLPELRPTAWERKDLHPLPVSLFFFFFFFLRLVFLFFIFFYFFNL